MVSKFNIIYEQICRSLGNVISESVINEKCISHYFILLLQGKDADASAFLKKMIPFDEARMNFETTAKTNYIDKYYDAAKKAIFAKKSYAEMNAFVNRAGFMDKFVAYAKKLVEEAPDPEEGMFNNESIEDITDPLGGKVTYKFHTGYGSTYIMTENNMSRRVKSEQGKGDTGLHDWQELIIFVQNDCSGAFEAREVRNIENAVVERRLDDRCLKIFGDVSLVPKIGYYVFEIKKLGELHPTYHPGHEVAKIDWCRYPTFS